MNNLPKNQLNVIITGATGMVGEGVLRECIDNDNVKKILVIGRKPCEIAHPKIREVIVPDLFLLSPSDENLTGYNACFFCAGVSSVGMDKDVYKRITYDMTMHVARVLAEANRDMTFCYVSGAGTDETESGRLTWARVKGRTENDLRKLPFKAAFGFRPGFIQPGKNYLRTNKLLKYVLWLFPVMRVFFPNSIVTMPEIAIAMIGVTTGGYAKNIINPSDIKLIAKK